MKPFFFTTVVVLTLLASVGSAYAAGTPNAKVPHLSRSVANPRNARVPFAAYYVGIHVAGYALSELTINLPEEWTVSKNIAVTDKEGQKVDATISIEERKAKFVFAQPVPPETVLEVSFKSVNTSTLIGKTWLLPISTKRADTAIEIPLGTAQINTYD
jgi:Protein of unknown function (DUF2808)